MATQCPECVKYENRLSEALEQLRMHEVAETLLGGGSWVWDIPEGVLTTSKGWQQVHGTSQSRFSMEQLMPIAYPDDNDEIESAFSDSMEKGVPYHLTHRIIRQDNGEVITIESYAEVVERDEEGNPSKMMGMIQDVSELKLAEEKLKFLATHDDLTDLPNRVLFMDRVAQAITALQRGGKPVSIMFIDLDGFKEVNDQLGHPMGDLLLKILSKRLSKNIRELDTVSRFGGDEFAILLFNLPGANAVEHIAQKLLEEITTPYELNEHIVTVTASIGIAISKDTQDTPEQLLKRADAAMYAVKTSGKNGIRFAD